MIYSILVLKGGLVYDRQVYRVEGFSLNTYIREMLTHGYGLDISIVEEA